MPFFKLLSAAIVLAATPIIGQAPVMASDNATLQLAAAKAQHRGGASHKHCHRRLRDGRFVTICHNHRHWPFHHTRKKG